uniref:HDC07171 n=1 Tax=Drosophila melanogaster TaxID=7227 RepID=Q6IG56_DROME|nr:TPA_inf: HDC07171 [Drosophila melanogaster]
MSVPRYQDPNPNRVPRRRPLKPRGDYAKSCVNGLTNCSGTVGQKSESNAKIEVTKLICRRQHAKCLLCDSLSQHVARSQLPDESGVTEFTGAGSPLKWKKGMGCGTARGSGLRMRKLATAGAHFPLHLGDFFCGSALSTLMVICKRKTENRKRYTTTTATATTNHSAAVAAHYFNGAAGGTFYRLSKNKQPCCI